MAFVLCYIVLDIVKKRVMLNNIGLPEIIIIALLLLIFIGSKKIPEFLRGIAESLQEVKKMNNDKDKENKV